MAQPMLLVITNLPYLRIIHKLLKTNENIVKDRLGIMKQENKRLRDRTQKIQQNERKFNVNVTWTTL